MRVLGIFEGGIQLVDESGNTYQWFTKSYSNPLFYSTGVEWYDIKATLFTFDHPSPKNGLKNVRVIKD